jgi:hypothetical protein
MPKFPTEVEVHTMGFLGTTPCSLVVSEAHDVADVPCSGQM